MNELYHSGIKGMTWKSHKYLRKIGNRYIYDSGSSAMNAARSAIDARRYARAAKNYKGPRRYINNQRSSNAAGEARESLKRARNSARMAGMFYKTNAYMRGREALNAAKRGASTAKRVAGKAAGTAADYARQLEKNTRNARARVRQAAWTGYYLTEPARKKVTSSKAYKTAKRSATNAYNTVRSAQTRAADTELHNRIVRNRKKRSTR